MAKLKFTSPRQLANHITMALKGLDTWYATRLTSKEQALHTIRVFIRHNKTGEAMKQALNRCLADPSQNRTKVFRDTIIWYRDRIDFFNP